MGRFGLAGVELVTSLNTSFARSRALAVLLCGTMLAGLPVAALLGAVFAEVERLTPTGAAAVAVGWMVTSLVIGTALSTPIAGWLESAGPRAALAVGPASLVIGIGLLARARRADA